jgi:phage gp29-like protein
MKIPATEKNDSAVLRRGGLAAFAGKLPIVGRFFGARENKAILAPNSAPPENPNSGLQTIILPHARTRWQLPAAAGMTPSAVGNILSEALTGRSPRFEHELYCLMEQTWPRLVKNTREVKNAVVSLEWNVMTADNGVPGMPDLLKRTMNGMRGDPVCDGQGWRGTLLTILDAWTRGISIVEIDWELRGGGRIPMAWLPKQTRQTPSWHYGWRTGPDGSNTIQRTPGMQPNDGRLVLYPDASAPGQGQDFPDNKFIIGLCKANSGHPSGGALLRALAWWWCAANFTKEWLLNFAQIFGQPFRWATYDAAQPDTRDALASMMENMGSAAWGVGPAGSTVEFHEAARNGSYNPQSYILGLADEACDLLILGQTLTTSAGQAGSRALGEVHADVRADIIDAAAQWLAEVLNEQLVPSVARINYGDPGEEGSLPWFEPGRKQVKDQKVVADTVKVLLEAGIPLSKKWVYETMDIPEPEEDEPVFGGAPAAPLPALGEGVADVPAVARALAALPLDAREYFLARLKP